MNGKHDSPVWEVPPVAIELSAEVGWDPGAYTRNRANPSAACRSTLSCLT